MHIPDLQEPYSFFCRELSLFLQKEKGGVKAGRIRTNRTARTPRTVRVLRLSFFVYLNLL